MAIEEEIDWIEEYNGFVKAKQLPIEPEQILWLLSCGRRIEYETALWIHENSRIVFKKPYCVRKLVTEQNYEEFAKRLYASKVGQAMWGGGWRPTPLPDKRNGPLDQYLSGGI